MKGAIICFMKGGSGLFGLLASMFWKGMRVCNNEENDEKAAGSFDKIEAHGCQGGD